MSERQQSLEAFDREYESQSGYADWTEALANVPFWDLVAIFVKSILAFLVASAILGLFVGGVYLAYALLTS